MPTNSLSRGLQELLKQQQRQADMVRTQYERELNLQKRQWQKEDAGRRQQQQAQRETLRYHHQSARMTLGLVHRREQGQLHQHLHSQSEMLRSSHKSTQQLFEQHAQQGLPAQLMLQIMKQADPALWNRLSPEHQQKLTRAASSGSTSGELAQLLKTLHQHDRSEQRHDYRRKLEELHATQQAQKRSLASSQQSRKSEQKQKDEQQNLTEQQKHERERDALRGRYHSKSRSLREKQSDARLSEHEKAQQRRREEQEQQRRQHDQQRRRQQQLQLQGRLHAERLGHLKQAGMSLARGNLGEAASSALKAAGPGAATVGGAFVAGYQATTKAMQAATKSMEIFGNSTLTGTQKMESFFKEFVPGAKVAFEFRDAIKGVNNDLRKMQMSTAHFNVRQAGFFAAESARQSVGAEIAHHRARAGAFGAIATVAVPNANRRTAAGEIRFQEQSVLYPAQLQAAKAEAGRSAAEREIKASQNRMNVLLGRRKEYGDKMADRRLLEYQLGQGARHLTGAQEKAAWDRVADLRLNSFAVEDAKRRRAERGGGRGPIARYMHERDRDLETQRAIREVGGGGEKVRRTKAGLAATQEEKNVLQNELQVVREINRQKQLGVTLAEKESAARKAQIGLSKAHLQILQMERQRNVSTATRLGGMAPWQRAQGLQAARMAKRVGIQNLPPALRQMAESFAPRYFQKAKEQAGYQTAEYKAGVKEFGPAFASGKGTNVIDKEIQKLQTKVQISVNLDEQALSQQIAKSLTETLKNLLESIETKFKAEAAKVNTGLNLRHANQT